MAGGVTLDAGPLVAAERNDRRFWALWREIAPLPKVIPAGVLAQVWRGQRSVPLIRVIDACRIEPLSRWNAEKIGELLARTGTRDIVDAAVMFGAAYRGDDILTTDVRDLRRLTVGVPFEGRIVDFTQFKG